MNIPKPHQQHRPEYFILPREADEVSPGVYMRVNEEASRCLRQSGRMKDEGYKHIQGFTLIEVLVALIIVSIALLAVIRTSHMSLTSQIYLEEKTTAHWIAANEIARLQLGLEIAPIEHKEITILDRKFYYSAVTQKTPDPHVDKIHLEVFNMNNQKRIDFIGFLAS
jgi:general secretion pathway protein I